MSNQSIIQHILLRDPGNNLNEMDEEFDAWSHALFIIKTYILRLSFVLSNQAKFKFKSIPMDSMLERWKDAINSVDDKLSSPPIATNRLEESHAKKSLSKSKRSLHST